MTPFQYGVQFLIDPADGHAWEGGYVNDPSDPGGETKYGISKRSYPDLDIKNLSLSDAMDIYKRDYWDHYKLDSFTIPYNIVMFDAYVQHRPSVVMKFANDAKGEWKKFNDARRLFYLRLIEKNPAMKKYQRGWLNRLNDLDKYCTIIEQEQI